jgi:hypothetical protein
LTKQRFNAVKVFSATKAWERSELGDRVTEWIRDCPDVTVVDIDVRQSSDSEFHCLSFTVFYYDPTLDD